LRAFKASVAVIFKTNETRYWINAKSSQLCKVKPRLGTAIEHGLIITGIAPGTLFIGAKFEATFLLLTTGV